MSDLVFREEGCQLKFVGDFDGVYREDDDPWEQSALCPGKMLRYYNYSRFNLASAVNQFAPPFSYLVEVGCGLGYALDYLNATCKIVPTGLDVSGVAIGRARKLFPGRRFIQADITAERFDVVGGYYCVVLNQLLWYVLHRLDATLLNCSRLLSPGGTLIISQAFLNEQRYGKEIVDGFDGLLKKLLNEYQSLFSLLGSRYDTSHEQIHHDGLLILQKCGEGK